MSKRLAFTQNPGSITSIRWMEQPHSSQPMWDSWDLMAGFTEGAGHGLSLPPAALRRERARGVQHGGSSSSLHRKGHKGPVAVALAAFASVVAVLFLVFHCVVALSREALPIRVERALAGEREKKGDGSGDVIPKVCGLGRFQSATATHSRRRSREHLGVDSIEEGSEDAWEPSKTLRQEALGWERDTSRSPFHVIARAEESTEEEEAAQNLRQSILTYVERTLAEKDPGVQEEDWLPNPFEELQFSEEMEATQSLFTVGSHAAKPLVESATSGFTGVATGPRAESVTFGLIPMGTGPRAESATSRITTVSQLWPEEGTAGSASQGEGSTQCSKVTSGSIRPYLDSQASSQGPIRMTPGQQLPAVQSLSKKPLVFRYIVGQPGTKGAYMLQLRKLLNWQEGPALAIASVPLPATPVSGQTPREVDITTHPYFRLPSVAPDASVRDIIIKPWSLLRRRTSCESATLLRIRELLKKPVLDSTGLERLMQNLEQLVEYAAFRTKQNIDGLKPKHIVEKLGFELLAMDGLHSASEVLGANAKRSEWWQRVVDTLPVYTGPTESAASRATAQQNILLTRFLQHALAFYRCGSRPPASLLVPLKQFLLCTPAVPPFRRKPWVDFVADDTEWQQSL